MTSAVRAKSIRFTEATTRSQVVQDCLGGTKTMRERGATYVPYDRNEAPSEEGHANYKAKLMRSTFTNFYAMAVDKHVGKVFARDIKAVDYDDRLLAATFNIDLNGRNLTQFARDVFVDGYHFGASFVLVDLPQNTATNLAEEQAAGIRPYLVHIPFLNMLDVRTARLDGVEKPVLVRYLEYVIEPISEFEEQLVEQVRVIRPGSWEVWQERAVDDKKTEWTKVDDGVNSFTEIPLSIFYTKRDGYGTGFPALQDLAEKNVEHWLLNVDLNNILHLTASPLLVVTGYKPALDPMTKKVAAPLVVGPNSTIILEQENAKVQYVEHNGNAIGKQQEQIENITKEMEALGMEPLQTVARTAAEANLTASEGNNLVRSFAMNLKDTLEQSLIWMGQYMGMEVSGNLDINTEYNTATVDASNYEQVIKLLDSGVITRETAITEAQRRSIIDGELTVEEVLADEPEPLPTVVADPLNTLVNNSGEVTDDNR